MQPELTDKQKLQILAQILASPDFKDSKRYQELLSYLVRESLAGNVPKEMTIGVQVFGKDKEFDPRDDATIRVYMNNLRKKLEHFYLTAAKGQAHRLRIPVGHYKVEFEPIAEGAAPEPPPAPSPAPAKSRTVIYLSAALVLAVSAVVYLYLRPGRDLPPATTPVLKEFLVPGGRPTLFVVGDLFFLFEHSDSARGGDFVRKTSINSLAEYRQIIRSRPEFAKRYVPSDISFLRPSAVWGLAELLPAFHQSPNPVSLKLASQLSADDLKTHNVIFVGSAKSLYSFDKLLHLYGLIYSVQTSTFLLRAPGRDSLITFSSREFTGGNYERDFVVVVKAPAPDGGTVLLIVGQGDAGVIAGCRAVMDRTLLAGLVGAAPGVDLPDPLHFRLVLETEGLNQTNFKTLPRWFERVGGGSSPGDATSPDSTSPH